jgi:peptidoglycan/LPS O-acetylase OafA/YrhL
LVGVFLGRVLLRATWAKLAAVSGLTQATGIVLIVAGAMWRRYAPWPLWGGLLYVPGSSLLVLGLVGARGFFAAHLSGRWLHRLGTASFSLYMVHTPILRAVKGICLHFGWQVQSSVAFVGVTAGMFVVIQTIALVMCYGRDSLAEASEEFTAGGKVSA